MIELFHDFFASHARKDLALPELVEGYVESSAGEICCSDLEDWLVILQSIGIGYANHQERNKRQCSEDCNEQPEHICLGFLFLFGGLYVNC